MYNFTHSQLVQLRRIILCAFCVCVRLVNCLISFWSINHAARFSGLQEKKNVFFCTQFFFIIIICRLLLLFKSFVIFVLSPNRLMPFFHIRERKKSWEKERWDCQFAFSGAPKTVFELVPSNSHLAYVRNSHRFFFSRSPNARCYSLKRKIFMKRSAKSRIVSCKFCRSEKFQAKARQRSTRIDSKSKQ